MSKHTDLGAYAQNQLHRSYSLKKKDLGTDAHLSKSGMTFDTEAYEIEGLGHLCVMRMKAFLGLMKMESVIIAPRKVDAPIINADWIRAFGKETQLVEIYDTQLQAWPQAPQEALRRLRDRDADLEDYTSGSHWYDSILYDCSYRKKSRNSERLNRAAQACLDAYISWLAEAPELDAASCEEKAAKVDDFSAKLLSGGGPAVNMFTKLFGPETAARIVRKHMYGGE